MNDDRERVLAEIARTRRSLLGCLRSGTMARGLAFAGAACLVGAVASRFVPGAPLAAGGAGLGGLILAAAAVRASRFRVTEACAAAFLDRVLEADEHFVASWELAQVVGGRDPRLAFTMRGARARLESTGIPFVARGAFESLVTGILLGVAAVAVCLLPAGVFGGGVASDDAAPLRAPAGGAEGVGAAPPPGAFGAGRSPRSPEGWAGTPADRASSPARTVPADRSSGPVPSGSPADTSSGPASSAASRPEPGSAMRDGSIPGEIVRLVSPGLSSGERSAILRSLEIPGSPGAASPSEAGAGADGSARPAPSDRGSAVPAPPGAGAPGEAPSGAAPVEAAPGRYPARYREVVARYFDPSL